MDGPSNYNFKLNMDLTNSMLLVLNANISDYHAGEKYSSPRSSDQLYIKFNSSQIASIPDVAIYGSSPVGETWQAYYARINFHQGNGEK